MPEATALPSEPLQAASYRLKLERALEHLQALEAAAQLWIQTDPCTVTHECEVKTRLHTLTLRVRQPSDPILPLLIGDAVHNMRQGLDHLAYRLAIVVSKKDPPPNRGCSMWPVRTKAKLPGAISNDVGPKKHMAAGMYAAFEALQQDSGSDGLLLNTLSRIDNRDKHRLLPVVAGLAEALDLQGLDAPHGVNVGDFIFAASMSGAGTIAMGAIDDGQVVVQSGGEMHVNVSPAPAIAFGKTSDVARGELILPLLREIHIAITDRVFPTFEAFL